jgi:predicted ATP-grasp superfamily ATP-dependent carboligase
VTSENGKRLNILLSEGSSLPSRQTVYALGGRYTIDILDSQLLCQGRFSRFVRKVHRCPDSAREPLAYLQFLIDLLGREHYDVLIPTNEQVYLFSRFRDALNKYVGLAVPEFVSISRVYDKVKCIELLDELNLPHPPTTIINTPEQLLHEREYPFYIKSAVSTAGKGVWYIQDRQALTGTIEILEQAGLTGGDAVIMVQQPAEGMLSGAHALFQDGRLVAAHCYETPKTGVGGSALVRESAHHGVVFKDLQLVGRHLEWHGAMHLEYCYDPAIDRASYIEINPRLTQTTNATLSGTNLCELLVQVSLNKPTHYSGPSRLGVRTHSALNAMLAAGQQGRGRKGILSELWSIMGSKGAYRGSLDDITRPQEDFLSLIPAVAVFGKLMLNPDSANDIVAGAVSRYSLAERAIQTIKDTPQDLTSHV